VKEALLAGRAPREKVDGITVAELCDRFLQEKEMNVNSGELSALTFRDYKRVTDRLVKVYGSRVVIELGPDGFAALKAEFAKDNGLVTLANFILRVRGVFKFAVENRLIDRAILFGTGFKPVRKEALKVHKNSRPKKLFSREEVAVLIDTAGVPLKAMILLAVNAGFGNTDCAALEFRHLDIEDGWATFARRKTGNDRRCPLWPETVKAIKAAIDKRPKPKSNEYADRVFVTKPGGTWDKGVADNPVSKEFAKTVAELKLTQSGRGFYSLRHTFRTIADGAKDLQAIRFIMGHSNGHVEAGYIEAAPDDSRLQAVTDHVRAWLLAAKPTGKRKHEAQRKVSSALKVVG
jgi:integrase